MRSLDKTFEPIRQAVEKISFPANQAFSIFETYGLPFEMIQEELKSINISLPENFQKDFDDAMTAHQDLSRTASAGMFK